MFLQVTKEMLKISEEDCDLSLNEGLSKKELIFIYLTFIPLTLILFISFFRDKLLFVLRRGGRV